MWLPGYTSHYRVESQSFFNGIANFWHISDVSKFQSSRCRPRWTFEQTKFVKLWLHSICCLRAWGDTHDCKGQSVCCRFKSSHDHCANLSLQLVIWQKLPCKTSHKSCKEMDFLGRWSVLPDEGCMYLVGFKMKNVNRCSHQWQGQWFAWGSLRYLLSQVHFFLSSSSNLTIALPWIPGNFWCGKLLALSPSKVCFNSYLSMQSVWQIWYAGKTQDAWNCMCQQWLMTVI